MTLPRVTSPAATHLPQMPSDDLLLHFQAHLALEDHWALNGTHYQKTCEAWLAKMDAHKAEALAVMEKVYGPKEKCVAPRCGGLGVRAGARGGRRP